MTNTSFSGPIYVDIRKSLDVRVLGKKEKDDWKEEFIQRDAFLRLEAIIQERLAAAKEARREGAAKGSILENRHSTITIHGTRGSGKTTFILNAVDHLCQDNTGLVNLGVLDPTLIGSKENLFLLILNYIKTKVDALRVSDAQRQEWEQSLGRLAGGLCQVDGVGTDKHLTGDQWEDAHYAMDQGLNKAGDGRLLEQNFHATITCALRLLGQDAFILALDDIDTDFQQGWKVLEILRRYLTSPQLIVILSGDMDLYSMLVRGRQWEHFPEKLLKHDGSMGNTIGDMVSHLQSQYLQKILPPAYRIGLSTFKEFSGNTYVRTRNAPNGVPVERFLREKLETCARLRGTTQDNALELILRQPVRTIVNLLALMDGNSGEALSRGLISQFTDVFARLRSDSDECHRVRAEHFPAFLAGFLTRNHAWENGHSLQPDLANEDLNLAFLAFAAKTGSYGLGHGFDYMLRICQFREVIVHYRPDLRSDERLSNAIDYLALDRRTPLLEISRHMSVLLRQADNSTSRSIRSGTVATLAAGSRAAEVVVARLYGQTSAKGAKCSAKAPEQVRLFREKTYAATVNRKLPDRWIGQWYNTPDTLLSRLRSATMAGLAGLPFSRILRANGERPTYASIHNVLGALADMIDDPSRIEAILGNASELRAYAIPDSVAAAPEAPAEDEEEQGGSEFHDMDLEFHPFVQRMRRWVEELAALEPLPPYVMARIWTRFFYSLGSIDENMKAHMLYLGDILHRQMVAFLNAALVEEAIYRTNSLKMVTLRNPITSDTNLIGNCQGASAHARVARHLMRCPLLAAYLKLELFGQLPDDMRPDLLENISYDVHENVPVDFTSLHILLNSIAVPGCKAPTERPPREKKSEPDGSQEAAE